MAKTANTSMAAQLRAAILAADDRPHKDEEVPEWGVTLRLRSLPGNLRARARRVVMVVHNVPAADLEAAAQRAAESPEDVEEAGPPEWWEAGLDVMDLAAEAVVVCAYDPETDERVFQPGDAAHLTEEKNGDVVERLFFVIMSLSGISDKGVAEAGKDS